MTGSQLLRYTKVSVLYLRKNNVSDRHEFSFDFINDDEALLKKFYAQDLSKLSAKEISRIGNLVIEIPRFQVVRTDSVDQEIGTITVALKRK